MVGMEHVANEVDNLVGLAEANKRRVAAGEEPYTITNHLIMSGNPGTGKSTVAAKVAELYHALGILPEAKVTHLGKAELAGKYANNTELAVKDTFEKGKGGVIFVDEAYMLANDEYGKRATDQMVKEIEENRNDTVVILAGYPKEMDALMQTNPGLASRFPRTIDFPDYTAKDQEKILGSIMERHNDKFAGPDTQKIASEAIKHVARTKQNARGVRNFHDALVLARSSRLRGKNPSREEDSTFVDTDISTALKTMRVLPAGKGSLVAS
jgi:SpoVK/Ycf46/Vps4 family AAA+-type ATPase